MLDFTMAKLGRRSHAAGGNSALMGRLQKLVEAHCEQQYSGAGGGVWG